LGKEIKGGSLHFLAREVDAGSLAAYLERSNSRKYYDWQSLPALDTATVSFELYAGAAIAQDSPPRARWNGSAAWYLVRPSTGEQVLEN
jgi:hypothetical protein